MSSDEGPVIRPAPLWTDEVGFSNWLHINIGLLASAISIPLLSRQREAPVGRLSADLLAEVEGTGERVIIENQIYAANHGHFGQVLTYAAHYDAKAIIWIASSFRNEYRAAIAWLNTLSHKQFFAVELLDASSGAPRLEVVAGPETGLQPSTTQQLVNIAPSSEARETAQTGTYVQAPYAVPAERSTSPGQLVLNAIFELVATLLSGSPTFPRLRRPTGDRNYYVISNGPVRGSEWAITFEDVQVGVGVVFTDGPSAKRDLESLREHSIEINSVLGYEVDFQTVQNRIKQKALVYRPFSYEQRSQEGEGIARWCVDTITTFAAEVQRLRLFNTRDQGTR